MDTITTTATIDEEFGQRGEPTSLAYCSSCPHDYAGHDATAVRYCAATLDMAISRGCVCRVDPVAVGWRTRSSR